MQKLPEKRGMPDSVTQVESFTALAASCKSHSITNLIQSRGKKRIKIVTISVGLALLASTSVAETERHVIDTRGQHAFIQFRIPHLGFSWLYGRFNEFEGEFTFDPDNPENARVSVEIQTPSIDTNHDRRDEHLRDEDFLAVDEHPVATFESTGFKPIGNGEYRLAGDLELMGRTGEISIDVAEIGAGEDPWGGYRRGFEGTTMLTLADWGIDYDLGPSAREVELTLSIEGIRQEP